MGILLPFSNGEYYREYLVNTTFFISEFTRRGFRLVTLKSFDKYEDDFAARNPEKSLQLSADDKKYLWLYGEMVFMREE